MLLNNRLGPYSGDPSIDGRMEIFKASIEQLLWPEKRDLEQGFDGFIVRTFARSNVNIPRRSIPPELKSLIDFLPDDPFRRVFDKNGNFKLGPIPKGFPIGLAANYQPLADNASLAEKASHFVNLNRLVDKVVQNFSSLDPSADDAKLLAWAANLGEPLLKLNKCPDFVVNRGHYFGTAKFNETDGLSDDEKVFGAEPPSATTTSGR